MCNVVNPLKYVPVHVQYAPVFTQTYVTTLRMLRLHQQEKADSQYLQSPVLVFCYLFFRPRLRGRDPARAYWQSDTKESKQKLQHLAGLRPYHSTYGTAIQHNASVCRWQVFPVTLQVVLIIDTCYRQYIIALVVHTRTLLLYESQTCTHLA